MKLVLTLLLVSVATAAHIRERREARGPGEYQGGNPNKRVYYQVQTPARNLQGGHQGGNPNKGGLK